MKIKNVKKTVVVAGAVVATAGLGALGSHALVGASAQPTAGAVSSVSSDAPHVMAASYGCRYTGPQICLKRSGHSWKVALQNKLSKTVKGKPAIQFLGGENTKTYRFATRSLAPHAGYQSSWVKCPRGYSKVRAGFLNTKNHVFVSKTYAC